MTCPACGQEADDLRRQRDAARAEVERLREDVVALQARLAAAQTVPARRGLASLITPGDRGGAAAEAG